MLGMYQGENLFALIEMGYVTSRLELRVGFQALANFRFSVDITNYHVI